jgi:hypothetical protein
MTKDVDGSAASDCSTVVYRYQWSTPWGRHTVFYEVKDGVIQDNIANERSPIKQFVGLTIGQFCEARMSSTWQWQDDKLQRLPANQ